jgi:hypothetical protein
MAGMELKKKKEQVELLLGLFPHLRDDDHELFAQVLYSKYTRRIHSGMSAFELIEEIRKKNVPHFESIRRVRQKLQEEEPELRGQKYAERHKRKQEVKSEIKQWTQKGTYQRI